MTQIEPEAIQKSLANNLAIQDFGSISSDITALEKWTEDWQIEFNVDKCSEMHLGSNNIEKEYKMNTNIIKKVKEEKDLGVLVDSKLQFKQHIDNVCNNANKTLGIIKRNFKNLSRKSFVLLYKALVRSKLEYANAIWSPMFKEDVNKIEKNTKKSDEVCKNFER